jgi:hypothetical protein
VIWLTINEIPSCSSCNLNDVAKVAATRLPQMRAPLHRCGRRPASGDGDPRLPASVSPRTGNGGRRLTLRFDEKPLPELTSALDDEHPGSTHVCSNRLIVADPDLAMLLLV